MICFSRAQFDDLDELSKIFFYDFRKYDIVESFRRLSALNCYKGNSSIDF